MPISNAAFTRRARLAKNAIFAASALTGAAIVAWIASEEMASKGDQVTTVQGPEFKDPRIVNTEREAALPASFNR